MVLVDEWHRAQNTITIERLSKESGFKFKNESIIKWKLSNLIMLLLNVRNNEFKDFLVKEETQDKATLYHRCKCRS